MIYKLEFPDKSEWVTAKDVIHLMQEYYNEFGTDFLDILSIDEIDQEKAKTIMLKCDEVEGEISLYDLAVGYDFAIVGSTDF